MRRVEVGARLVTFAAKGGHNDEPHNHNDLGSFTLGIDGEDVLVDLGAGPYTRAYFGEERYAHLHASSLGHSVPVVAGEAQRGGVDARARVLDVRVSPDAAALTLDLTSAYPAATSVIRSFSWQDEAARASLHLRDEATFDPAGILESALVSLIRPEAREGEVEWVGAAGTVLARFDPHLVRPKVEATAARTHGGAPITVYRARFVTLDPSPRAAIDLRVTVTPHG